MRLKIVKEELAGRTVKVRDVTLERLHEHCDRFGMTIDTVITEALDAYEKEIQAE
jgi:hypothetical protein